MEAPLWAVAAASVVGSAALCGLGCAGCGRRGAAEKKNGEHLPRHVVVCLLLTPCPHWTQEIT